MPEIPTPEPKPEGVPRTWPLLRQGPSQGRPPFNELSVLFPILTIYTVGYLALMIAEFMLKGTMTLPTGMMPIYIALVGAYAADKEVRRWAGNPEPSRNGALFVYLWLIFFMVAFVIRSFRPEYRLPGELSMVTLQVLGIFFGSRASKSICAARVPPEDPDAVGRRDLQIVEMIKTQGRIKNSDVADEFKISDASARRVLSAMVDKGLIRRVGERKATYYETNG